MQQLARAQTGKVGAHGAHFHQYLPGAPGLVDLTLTELVEALTRNAVEVAAAPGT